MKPIFCKRRHSLQLDVKRNRAFTKWVANKVLTVHMKWKF